MRISPAWFLLLTKREFMRRGINQHTLEKICTRELVRAIKLAKCLNALEEYESEHLVDVSVERNLQPWI